MWSEPWQREEWVVSRAGLRYLEWAFWGQVPFFLISPFLVYWSLLAFKGLTTPLASSAMQVGFGIIGGTGAIGGIILADAMKVFQRNKINVLTSHDKMWRFLLSFGVIIGPAVFYWFVYRPKMREAGFVRQ